MPFVFLHFLTLRTDYLICVVVAPISETVLEGFVDEGALFSPVRDGFKADTRLLTRCFENSSSHAPGKLMVF